MSVPAPKTPNSPGVTGTITSDANYIYVCTSTNYWKRTPLNVWPPVIVPGYADGASGAVSGTAQLPSILSGYTYRPPWKCAGVDYKIGPRSTPILNPATSPPANCTYDSGNKRLVVGADNVTIQGYDFSVNNGVYIYNPSFANLIIEDCLLSGTNYPALFTGIVDHRGNGITIQYCTIDGTSSGGSTNLSALITIFFYGKSTIQYNDLKGSPSQIVSYGFNATWTDGPQVYRWNLIRSWNIGTGQHMNAQQYIQCVMTQPLTAFNTVYCNTTPGAGANPGEVFQEYGNNAGANLIGPQLTNNTIIAVSGSGSVSYMLHGDQASVPVGGTVSGNAICRDNFFDPSGCTGGAIYPSSFSSVWNGSGLYPGTNMNTGVNVTF